MTDMKRPVDAVIEYLEAEQARGKTHILLDEAARDGLRNLYLRARENKTPRAATTTAAAPASAASPTAAASPAAIPVTELRVSGSSKEEQLASLKEQAERWAPARNLGTLRDTMVFATGNPNAELMLIGEAPGYEEERRKEPFVGPAGKKLDDILKAMGLNRSQVYISNIVKYRPIAPRQTTNNRQATPEEMASFMPFIREEIQIVQPSCIIALGTTAAEGLLGVDDTVGNLRERWHRFENIPLRVSYHPSYLLQSDAGNDIKRKVWEDMLAVMEQLGMPISDRQRGFFLPK